MNTTIPRWTGVNKELVINAISRFCLEKKRYPVHGSKEDLNDIQKDLPEHLRKDEISLSRLNKLIKLARDRFAISVQPTGNVSDLTEVPKVCEDIYYVQQDIMVEISHLLDVKLEPILKLLNKEREITKLTVEPLQPEPVVTKTENAPFETQGAQVLTEKRVREIFVEELEKIFGPISSRKESHTHPKEIEPSPTFIPFKSEKPTLPKVYIFGLTNPQLERLKKPFGDKAITEGSSAYNDSSRGTAKNADLVIVTKFTTHSKYDSVVSQCGKDKVVFVSGGVTMVKKKISAFLAQKTQVSILT